ncbi:MAG: folate-binding protein, partial [Thiomicrorhabdus sp.]|nr:folate-binding protein [Thiomicrorhabdus sp.]
MTAQTTLNPIWSDFLASQNAQFDNTGKISTFGHPELERFLIKNGPVVTSLTDQALIKVSGSDALTFLQAQLTSDINEVTDNKAQFSAYCDPQGQVLANFLVFKYNNDFYLNFDGSLRESILKRLTMFVLRSDVQLTEVSNELIHIGFAGEFGDLDIQRRLSTKVKEVFESGMAELE